MNFTQPCVTMLHLAADFWCNPPLLYMLHNISVQYEYKSYPPSKIPYFLSPNNNFPIICFYHPLVCAPLLCQISKLTPSYNIYYNIFFVKPDITYANAASHNTLIFANVLLLIFFFFDLEYVLPKWCQSRHPRQQWGAKHLAYNKKQCTYQANNTDKIN